MAVYPRAFFVQNYVLNFLICVWVQDNCPLYKFTQKNHKWIYIKPYEFTLNIFNGICYRPTDFDTIQNIFNSISNYNPSKVIKSINLQCENTIVFYNLPLHYIINLYQQYFMYHRVSKKNLQVIIQHAPLFITDLPSLRHCRIKPPEDMFFSASISLKFRELANTSTSTIAINRLRKVTAVSADMPCVTSMFSNSVFKKWEDSSLFKIWRCNTCTYYRWTAV